MRFRMLIQAKCVAASFLTVLAVVAVLCPFSGRAQNKKLSKQDVIDLLTGDVASERVAQIAKNKGISFAMTAADESDIRQAGGADDLIRVLRGLSPESSRPVRTTPSATSPPVLIVQSSPGASQVYIDDEPVGSTSHEGRLKLTRFPAGDHQVRVALSGYQDFEKAVTLTEGQTTTLAATLQVVPPAPAANPVQQPATPGNPAATTGQPGFLGVEPMAQQPAGARGVVISGAAPGGPAEQAGLKTYDTIVAVDGRAVRTPQELLSVIGSHHAGDVVLVSWYNGTASVTRQIRLAAQSAAAATPYMPSLNPRPQGLLGSFAVAHDHGQGGQNYCVGVMTIGNGMVVYKSANGQHNLEFPLSSVKEARKNAVYLVAVGGFHIRLAKGTNYNFVALNQSGKWQAPDTLLTFLDQAMGK